jgi:hypothetical protein
MHLSTPTYVGNAASLSSLLCPFQPPPMWGMQQYSFNFNPDETIFQPPPTWGMQPKTASSSNSFNPHVGGEYSVIRGSFFISSGNFQPPRRWGNVAVPLSRASKMVSLSTPTWVGNAAEASLSTGDNLLSFNPHMYGE